MYPSLFKKKKKKVNVVLEFSDILKKLEPILQ